MKAHTTKLFLIVAVILLVITAYGLFFRSLWASESLPWYCQARFLVAPPGEQVAQYSGFPRQNLDVSCPVSQQLPDPTPPPSDMPLPRSSLSLPSLTNPDSFPIVTATPSSYGQIPLVAAPDDLASPTPACVNTRLVRFSKLDGDKLVIYENLTAGIPKEKSYPIKPPLLAFLNEMMLNQELVPHTLLSLGEGPQGTLAYLAEARGSFISRLIYKTCTTNSPYDAGDPIVKPDASASPEPGEDAMENAGTSAQSITATLAQLVRSPSFWNVITVVLL